MLLIREVPRVAYPSGFHAGTRLPKMVDHRSEMPPVADQGDFGSNSCVTFATAYYQMTQYVKHFKHPEWDLTNPEPSSALTCLEPGRTGFAPKVYEGLKKSGCVDAAEMQYDRIKALISPPRPVYKRRKPYRISGYGALWDHYGTGMLPPYDPSNSNRVCQGLARGRIRS